MNPAKASVRHAFRFGDIIQADASGRYVLMADRRYMVVAKSSAAAIYPWHLLALFDTGDLSRLIKVENMVGLELVESLA